MINSKVRAAIVDYVQTKQEWQSLPEPSRTGQQQDRPSESMEVSALTWQAWGKERLAKDEERESLSQRKQSHASQVRMACSEGALGWLPGLVSSVASLGTLLRTVRSTMTRRTCGVFDVGTVGAGVIVLGTALAVRA